MKEIISMYPESMFKTDFKYFELTLGRYLLQSSLKDKSFLKFTNYCSFTKQKPSNPTSLINYYKIIDIDLWIKCARSLSNSRYGILYEYNHTFDVKEI